MKISIATLALIQGLALATPMGTRTSRSVARIEQRNAAPTTTGAAPTNPAEVPDTAISHNKESDRVGSGNKLADDELADDEITDNELPDDELSDDTRSSSHPSPHSTETSNPDSEADSPFYFRGRHPFDKGEDTDDEIPELPYDGPTQNEPPQNKLPQSELSDAEEELRRTFIEVTHLLLSAFDRGKIKVNEALTDGVPNNELSQSKPPQNKLPRSELSDSKPPYNDSRDHERALTEEELEAFGYKFLDHNSRILPYRLQNSTPRSLRTPDKGLSDKGVSDIKPTSSVTRDKRSAGHDLEKLAVDVLQMLEDL